MRTRYKFFENENYPYFMTSAAVAWLPLFSRPANAEVILDSWRFLQANREIQIHAYVILENHLHWIASGPSLAKRVGEFKSFTARTIINTMQVKGYATLLQELQHFKLRHKIDQDHQLWQEGSHPQQIQTEEMMWQKVEYIHNNPLRRGYVEEPVRWRYSSASSYAGKKGLIEIDQSWR